MTKINYKIIRKFVNSKRILFVFHKGRFLDLNAGNEDAIIVRKAGEWIYIVTYNTRRDYIGIDTYYLGDYPDKKGISINGEIEYYSPVDTVFLYETKKEFKRPLSIYSEGTLFTRMLKYIY